MNPIRVFVVDDSAIFLRGTVRFLEEHKELAVAGTANNGHEALEQALSLQPDVILLDLHMPGLSGLEALPRLRNLLPTAGIIVWTICDYEEYRQAALAKGADEFIPKHKLLTDLLPAIQRVAKLSEGELQRGDPRPTVPQYEFAPA